MRSEGRDIIIILETMCMSLVFLSSDTTFNFHGAKQILLLSQHITRKTLYNWIVNMFALRDKQVSFHLCSCSCSTLLVVHITFQVTFVYYEKNPLRLIYLIYDCLFGVRPSISFRALVRLVVVIARRSRTKTHDGAPH